jgi:hypothetical protein
MLRTIDRNAMETLATLLNAAASIRTQWSYADELLAAKKHLERVGANDPSAVSRASSMF